MTEHRATEAAVSEITHAELGAELARLHFGVGASDLHGSLTGFLCAGGNTDSQHWLQALHIETPPSAASNEVLLRMFQDCMSALGDPDLHFEPLLPDQETPIDERASALVEWCRGFLGGLGLGGSPAASASDDASEILRDIGTIAGSRFEYENEEEDESALAEVIEFVRVGVLLLHTELTSSKRRDVTVH
ncbi:MAG: UPF0149 family protein [Rudaea sp.]